MALKITPEVPHVRDWIIVVLICTAYIVAGVLWGRHRLPQLPEERISPWRHGLTHGLMGGAIGFFFLLLYRSKAGALGLPLGGPIALLLFFVFGTLLGELVDWILTRLG